MNLYLLYIKTIEPIFLKRKLKKVQENFKIESEIQIK